MQEIFLCPDHEQTVDRPVPLTIREMGSWSFDIPYLYNQSQPRTRLRGSHQYRCQTDLIYSGFSHHDTHINKNVVGIRESQ